MQGAGHRAASVACQRLSIREVALTSLAQPETAFALLLPPKPSASVPTFSLGNGEVTNILMPTARLFSQYNIKVQKPAPQFACLRFAVHVLALRESAHCDIFCSFPVCKRCCCLMQALLLPCASPAVVPCSVQETKGWGYVGLCVTGSGSWNPPPPGPMTCLSCSRPISGGSARRGTSAPNAMSSLVTEEKAQEISQAMAADLWRANGFQ